MKNSLAKSKINDRMVEFIFENGVVYQGEERNGLRHGWGKQIFEDGAQYEGDWADDLPNGKGIFIQPDGGRYEGEFKN